MQIVVDLRSVINRVQFDEAIKPRRIVDVNLIKLYLSQTIDVNVLVCLSLSDDLKRLSALWALAALLFGLHLNIFA